MKTKLSLRVMIKFCSFGSDSRFLNVLIYMMVKG